MPAKTQLDIKLDAVEAASKLIAKGATNPFDDLEFAQAEFLSNGNDKADWSTWYQQFGQAVSQLKPLATQPSPSAAIAAAAAKAAAAKTPPPANVTSLPAN